MICILLAKTAQKARMMSRIGNKKSGFTLVEVMMATLVLVVGVVFIYEALFISLDAFNYCADYLELSPWVDEQLWLAQDKIMRLGPNAAVDASGELYLASKKFDWNISSELLNEDARLYKIDVGLFWRQNKSNRKILRSTYSIHAQEENSLYPG
ncbi:prepilin-type N-terminal cleavage/methylation domain-containing protein [bacterium]|nr:MAG: prepilin-type N-terminal cleavage/methylation domain-containing protein [bacterium]